MYYFAVIFIFFVSSANADFSECLQHFYKEPPKVPTVGKELCYSGYAVLYSPATKTPIYSAEHLSKSKMDDAVGEARTNRFFEEERLALSERSTLDDYKDTGYDRGHMAPAGDMPTPTAMAESFSLANIVPQVPKHNRGAWKVIEGSVRSFVKKSLNDVYIITGPYFQTEKRMNSVAVPTHIFKVVFVPATGQSWAYWQENSKTTRVTKPVTVAFVEAKTGIKFNMCLSLKNGGRKCKA